MNIRWQASSIGEMFAYWPPGVDPNDLPWYRGKDYRWIVEMPARNWRAIDARTGEDITGHVERDPTMLQFSWLRIEQMPVPRPERDILRERKRANNCAGSKTPPAR